MKTVLSNFGDAYTLITNMHQPLQVRISQIGLTFRKCQSVLVDSQVWLAFYCKIVHCFEVCAKTIDGSEWVEAMAKYSGLAEKDVVVLEEFITGQCPVTLSDLILASTTRYAIHAIQLS